MTLSNSLSSATHVELSKVNPASSILIIDDDVELSELFKDYLEQEFFDVSLVHAGIAGLDAALSGQYESGYSGCHAARYAWYRSADASSPKKSGARHYVYGEGG